MTTERVANILNRTSSLSNSNIHKYCPNEQIKLNLPINAKTLAYYITPTLCGAFRMRAGEN